MAKSGLPSVDDFKGPPVAKPEQVPEPTNGEASEGYIPRNVDVRMTRAQAKILRDKLRALQDSGAKTADGRFVDNRAQAVRWILENEVVA
jgi:hypothetical protein